MQCIFATMSLRLYEGTNERTARYANNAPEARRNSQCHRIIIVSKEQSEQVSDRVCEKLPERKKE